MSLFIKLLKVSFVGFMFVSVIVAISIGLAYLYFTPQLPSVESLKDIQLQTPLRVYSREGDLIAEYGEKRRIPLTYGEIPQQMINAFLAAEDDRFFEHPGVDYQGILRAVISLALTRERAQGGSTITMQVARNFFLTPEKSYVRKIKEILLAFNIENTLTKHEILALYLNKIYLGKRAYGVGAAAQIYYNKTVSELSIAQIAMIAGLPKAPSTYNPLNNPERAIIRRNYVLGRMFELDMISQSEYEESLKTAIEAKRFAPNISLNAPYVAEMARAALVEQYGEEAYTFGYSVYTTLESAKQKAAVQAVQDGILNYERRHGYRGAEGTLPLAQLSQPEAVAELLASMNTVGALVPAVVSKISENKEKALVSLADQQIELTAEDLQWAREYKNVDSLGSKPKNVADVLAEGDIIRVMQTEEGWQLAQIPTVSSALVSMRSADGAIIALTGGFDYFTSKFNRATQALRQPGSAFKPFIYSAALHQGYTPASIVNDAPIVFENRATKDTWRPHNYSGKFFGPTRLRAALTTSRNMVSIRLLRDIGQNTALNHIAKFGFDTEKMPKNLTLALGSGAVTPLQLASGYAVFSNGGFKVEPYFIDRIEDSAGEILFQANPVRVCDAECERIQADITLHEKELAELGLGDSATQQAPMKAAPRVVSAVNIYQMDSMLKDVIRLGTGKKALALGRRDIAGKTGTTNEQRDAWFAGYNPNIATVVWTGFDNHAKLGRLETGGAASLPTWIDYMRVALADLPEIIRPLPEDMLILKVNPDNGLLVDQDSGFGLEEAFHIDNIPGQDRTFRVPGSVSNSNTQPGTQTVPEQIF
jgi:penicillin-binding protein 1A